ncbi:MAG: RagB/SusD family nutrient uptake outer membrane protein [Bacteroidales bacterium]|nr:RagB/SusD family nutrient uptake outer membrane protein [Bacteroidales bacterium]
MKKALYIIMLAAATAAVTSSCADLLEMKSTYELSADQYWKTVEDAETALSGVYASARMVFDREYYWDGHGDYLRAKTGTMSMTPGYSLGYAGCRFDAIRRTETATNYYKYLYGLVHRANYVIENIRKMSAGNLTPSDRQELDVILAETRLLRGLGYFRLITMWGDVPYFDKVVDDNSIAYSIPRTPIEIVKDSVLADMTYAADRLPDKAPAVGRVGKAAAFAFRGKVQLYWACWNNFGWPELGELGTFVPDKQKALAAYAAAASDFREIILNESKYGVALFRNGEPGECGPMGTADVLPNYYYMFIPSTGNDSPESIMVMTHGGPGTDQCEELMRDFGTKSIESSEMQLQPRLRIVNAYQSTVTGDYCDELIYYTTDIIPDGVDPHTYKNCYLNPDSYKDRDYRMKASIVWEYEVMPCMNNLKSTGYKKYSYKNLNGTDVGGSGLDAINADADESGVIMRKFVRNYAGQGASEGNFNFPIMRLADVYLMYAEAVNEANDGPDALAVELVNRIRHRGNLPPLAASKYATKENFFNAVIQERIVELFAEGHRAFDLRRWRLIGNIAGSPMGNGLSYFDTWGVRTARMLHQADNITYKRAYIFQIPPKEIDKNQCLLQTPCWIQ